MLLTPFVTLADGSALTHLSQDHEHHSGEAMLGRVISSTLTAARIPGAGTHVSRLVTTVLDPFLSPAKEVAVLFHERWQAELVIGESRTVLRLSARTLRSLTPQGVIQERSALLLAHTVLRTLMLRAATHEALPPPTVSRTATIRILDESLLPLGMVAAPRRHIMVDALLDEIAQQRVPKQRVRLQARVVTRVRSRSERTQPEHWLAPPLVLDGDVHQIIALVTCFVFFEPYCAAPNATNSSRRP